MASREGMRITEKPTTPTVKPEPVLIQEDSSDGPEMMTVLLSTIIVILLTFILNMNYNNTKNPKVIYQQKVVTEVIVKEKEPLINLSNNEKAAMFLLIPGCIMGYFLITGMSAGARAGKQKFDSFGRKYI